MYEMCYFCTNEALSKKLCSICGKATEVEVCKITACGIRALELHREEQHQSIDII